MPTGAEQDVKPKVREESKEVKDVMRAFGDLSEEQRRYVFDHIAPPQIQEQQVGMSLGSIPRLAIFSDQPNKDSVSFDIWKAEVRGLNQYPEQVVMQAVRRSVRGRAAEVVLHEGEKGLEAVLSKMDQLYGNVLTTEQILEQFYRAVQENKEDVATWACRLEDLIGKLRSKDAISEDAAASMLRTKFFTGLREEKIKNTLRHRFDSKEQYSALLVAARVEELETTSTVHQHSQQVDRTEKMQFDRVMKALESIENRIEKLEVGEKSSERETRRNRHWRKRDSQQQQQQQQFQEQQRQHQLQNQQPQQQFQDQKPQQQFQTEQQQSQQYRQQQSDDQGAGYQHTYFNGNCYSCGGYGHRASCCPLNLYPLASVASRQAGNRGPYWRD